MAEAGHSSRTYSASFSNDILVGIDDKLYSIKDRLTGYPSKLDVLSIVGMGGIGKTTLARKIYDDSSIADYFDVRAWTTLSQKYELVDTLLGLMQQFCHGDISKIDDLESSRAVGEQLWKGLKGQRFLVVIDDIWDVEAWKSLRIFFPDDCNGSRIILTSRNVEVAKYVNPNNPPYELNLMDPKTSWELLSKKVFLRDSCPEELVPIGNAIALKCQGLPLAINVVGGHLAKVGKTCPDWHKVEKQLPSIQGNVLDILALSYNHLPVHLQKLFLLAANEYAELSMRIDARLLRKFRKQSTSLDARLLKKFSKQLLNLQFPITTKKLMSLWIAAGYIHAESPRSLEDVAEECLQELGSRNLIILTNKGYRGRPTCYIVHDLLIDMYRRLDGRRVIRRNGWKESMRDRIMHDLLIDMCRRLDGTNRNGWKESTRDQWLEPWLEPLYSYSHGIYPFAIYGGDHSLLRSIGDRSLLQSIDRSLLRSIQESFHLSKWVHLKHLEISTSSLPTSVYKLPNLQTLINPKAFPFVNLPRDIWMMSQLRHLHVGDSTYLPSPRQSHTEEFGIPILKNLQSVTLSSSSCTREICEGIPNLRRLKLYEIGECNVEEQSVNCLNNLCFLAQLQSLRLRLDDPPRCLGHWKSPPPNLRKLTLEGTRLGREDTMVLASLPNLEVLKLKYKYFEMDRWVLEHDDDIFHKLRFLLLECQRLELWEANSNNFPNLQHLVLRNCLRLQRIPLEVGEICTLQVMELYSCSRTAVKSAREIQQEQCDMGNDDFKVHMDVSLDWPEQYVSESDYFWDAISTLNSMFPSPTISGMLYPPPK